MNKLIRSVVLLVSATLLCGCASPYMTDRGRDAADIFTATIGGGLGGKARVGPIQAGLLFQADGYGLRGGKLGRQSSSKESGFVPPTHDIQLLLSGNEAYEPGGRMVGIRQKEFATLVPTPVISKLSSRHPCVSYYTQIDVVAAAGLSVRLGFNPGELIDFVLGWTTLDIFDDDVAWKRAE